MKVITAALLVLCVLILASEAKLILKHLEPPPVETPDARSTKAPQWHSISQRVDHFNPRDTRTWTMRYISNDQFFEDGRPIFIYLGGEWTIFPGSLQSGQVFELAAQHRGYMFYTEHRYYGFSYPTGDMRTENLRYLSVDQAIADVAYFIQYVKANISGLQDSKVVIIGCSYSGSMATWIRLKYPHLIDIAYASSAPVKAVADFYVNTSFNCQYFEVVDHNIDLVSKECLQTINEGTTQLEKRLQTEDGILDMSQRLYTCARIQNNEPHRSFLFKQIAQFFAALVQRAGPTSIQDKCTQLLSYEGTSLDKLVSYVRSYYGTACIDNYDDFIRTYAAIENTNNPYRPWLYQTCTEYGYYQTTTSNYQPFGDTFALEYFLNVCRALFGEDFGTEILNTGVKRTNLFYGSLTPEITKVISVHGTVDPWHALGILKDLNPWAPAILINGTSHCADLRPIRDNNPPQLTEAQRRVQDLIAKWLE